MPWDISSEKDARLRFIAALLEGETMSAACLRHGISRQTGYTWWRRWEAEGPAGLEPRSSAPKKHGRAISAVVQVSLIEARRRRPHWGPKKLVAKLAEADPGTRWPSPSSVSELFRREKLSTPRRTGRRALEAAQPFGPITAPNDTWCIDFKGWIRTLDGRRCDPFTVTDAYSRFLLELTAVDPTGEAVDRCMDQLFERHGLPKAIRSDNGPPFASSGAGGMTKLAAKWIKLGIRLERIQPGRPQQNGRHERMHLTLKQDACTPPSADLQIQQARFDVFRYEFNHERPHEALGQIPPARLYAKAGPPRPMPDQIKPPVYEPEDVVRQVRQSGEIRWCGKLVFVSEALVGEPVALREQPDGHWRVSFANVPLLLIDRHTQNIARYRPGRPPRAIAAQQPAPEVSGR